MKLLENIQIIPYGEVPATSVSGKKVVQHFTLENFKRIIDNLNVERQNSPDIVLDLDHSSETTSDTSAAGWLSNFRICQTRGLLADIELTPIGEDAVFNKIYKYLSPAVVVDAQGNPYKLTSVALTNRPRIKHIERIWNSISNAFSNIKKNIKSIFNSDSDEDSDESDESEVDVNTIKEQLDKNVLLEGQLFMEQNENNDEQLEQDERKGQNEDIIEEREERIEQSDESCENDSQIRCESTSEDSSEQLDEESVNVNSSTESTEELEDKTLRDKILEFLSTFLTSKEEVEKLATFTDDEIISLLQSTFDFKRDEVKEESDEVQEDVKEDIDEVQEEVVEEVVEETETLNSDVHEEETQIQVINQAEASTPELEQISKLQEEYSLLNSPNARADFLLKHRGQLFNHIVK